MPCTRADRHRIRTLLTWVWKVVLDFDDGRADRRTLQHADDLSVFHTCRLLAVDRHNHIAHFERVAPAATSS